jgi:hypothetical protein
MAKRLTREEKWQLAVVDLINKMFEIAGHSVTYEDVKDRKDAWYSEWTMTMEQYEEWKRWGEKYLQKKLNMYPKSAEKQMSYVGLMWGLKFSDFPKEKN